MSPDERAIRELIDAWMKASRAGDTETVLSLMSDDVIFMVSALDVRHHQPVQDKN